MLNIDFHMHSEYSDDGELTVKQIMELCKQQKIDYMAITDHNSIKSVPEALAIAPQMGITAVAGVELDCTHMGRNFHLLGYNFDYTNPMFDKIEQSILMQEQNAAKKKIELIAHEINLPICTDEVLAAAKDGIVTGELIAEILLKNEDAGRHKALQPYIKGGARDDNPYVNFYWDYFSQGKPAYVPIEYISLSEGVELIKSAGGISVLAHPGQNLKGDYGFLEELIKTGINGIEAYSSYHSQEDAQYFADIAQKNKLLITCGSDFHGKIKPAISLLGHGAGNAMPEIIRELAGAGVISPCV